MALTKVTGQVINDTTGLVVGVTTVGGGISATDGFFSGIVTAVGNASFSGNVSVGGTLTYEDVTNIDAVGLITARNGVVVGSGITLSKDGDGFFTGVVTATSYAGDGSSLTGIAATDNVRTGILDVAGVGTFRGDVNIPDKIIHLGDTDTAIRFPAADTVSFETGGSEAARFDSNGNLLVGATSYQNGGFGGTAAGINIAGTQPQILLHETDTDKDGYFGLAASILRIQTADSIPVTIWTNDTKRINVHETTGDTTLETGNLVIGTAGKGIDFSADGNASGASSEVLDDYEEGTFTPTMANSVTLHSSNDLLSYIKVGHLVHVTGVVRINSGNSSSDISITNMPFATVNASDQAGNAIGSVSIYDNNMNSGYSQVICVMNPNSTQLNVVLLTQSGSQQLGMDAADNGYIGVSICYRAA